LVRFKIEHPRQLELISVALAVLGLAWLYLHSLSPAFPPNDSPETIAAALSLGIQHPPGYPLATLLGRLSILALGSGSAAWRVNSLSVLLAEATLLLAGALAFRLSAGLPRSARWAAALGSGLWLGLNATLWEQATEAKGGLYLLNLALGFGLWHACLSAQNGSRRGLRAAALFAGLLLADHFLSAAPWLAVAAVWLLWTWRQGRLSRDPGALLWVLPGVLLYLYLPLRAAWDPALDLGHPSTWAQFKWMLSRAGYGQGPALNRALVLDQLRVLGRALLSWSGGLGLVLALIGLRWLWIEARPSAWALGAAALLSIIAGSVLNPTPADNRWLVLIFSLPGLALLALFAGLGLGRLCAQPRLTLPLLLAVAAGLGFLAWRQWPRLDRRGSFVAWDYANDLALSLPQGALYLGEGDYHVLPLLELQARGRRPDVAVVLSVLAGQPWYQDLLQRREPGLLLAPAKDDATAAAALAVGEAARRPVLLSPFAGRLDAAELQPLRLRQRGLAREASPRFDSAVGELPRAWAGRVPARQGEDLEPVEAALLPWYTVALVQMGNEALDEHRLAESLDAYHRAVLRPGTKPEAAIRVNEARAWEAAGSAKAARLAYEAAIQADPSFEPAREGLAALQAHAKQGLAVTLAKADRLAAAGTDDVQALKLYDDALQAGFQTANLWRNIGVIFMRHGDKAQASRAFRRALELKPGDATLLQYLAVVSAP
jgi:tetratricopeptide (TPR) repeat protein